MASMLDVVKVWNVDALKDFCRRKGLKVSGRKDELIARVFFAKEQDLPDVPTSLEEQRIKAATYERFLNTPHGRQPDPSDLCDGWVSEDTGKYLWPPTMYSDMCTYMLSVSGKIDIGETRRTLNAYKEGKAFSYLESNWLKEVFYHPISPKSVYCYLKSACVPSQRVNDVPHQAWVMIKKDIGEIQSAYCTCFAGLGSSCNHIAAMLFKMDLYWRQGYTNKSCTDKLCQWNRYGAVKKTVEPIKVKDMKFKKPEFGKLKKRQTRKIDQGYTLNIDEQDLFTFEDLYNALSTDCPDAVVFQGLKSLSPDDVVEVEIETSAPPPLSELLYKCETAEDILCALKEFTNYDVNSIENATRGQAGNQIWKLQRTLRITSSSVHDVYTKVNTLKNTLSNISGDVSSLMKRITEVDQINSQKIPALKYGLEMENEAREHYKTLMLAKHKGFQVQMVGLVILQDSPQYGASADGYVSCECCKPGLVEIKCPLTVAHTIPSQENLPYLIAINNETTLSRKHKYFSQIQWQMGVCGKDWCDFFVFSRHGYYLQRIEFDSDYFSSLKTNADYFFTTYVIPEILKKKK